MLRFILVSFAFLGWAFYELSGGADFAPPKRPEPVAAVKPGILAPRPVKAAAAPLKAQPLLTQRSQIQAPARPAANPAAHQRAAADRLTRIPSVLASSQTAFPGGPDPLQFISLTGGLAAVTAVPASGAPLAADTTSPVPEAAVDRRTIRASRVNMRQGPGTAYPVITRLLGGDEVIVIEDPGTGWLHLRAPDKGHVGWIAASLVSKKRP